MARPTGITILSILAGISALFLILGGLALVIGGSLLASVAGGTGGGILGALGGLLGVFLLVWGLVYAVATWGLWTGKPWAWTVTFGLTALGLVISVVGFNIIGIVIDAAILWYLWQPAIKAFYGKAPAPTAVPATP
jgi:hypothetical protein